MIAPNSSPPTHIDIKTSGSITAVLIRRAFNYRGSPLFLTSNKNYGRVVSVVRVCAVNVSRQTAFCGP